MTPKIIPCSAHETKKGQQGERVVFKNGEYGETEDKNGEIKDRNGRLKDKKSERDLHESEGK